MLKQKKIDERLARIKEILPDLRASMHSCELCLRKCGADRAGGKKGYCSSGKDIELYTYSRHRGEEPPLSGKRGSGTIFFSRCTMGCVYCQNFTFSQLPHANNVITPKEMSRIMLGLEDKGCHNINLVNPTHFAPQIVRALEIAYLEGLTIPVIYNTGGYDSAELIRKLEGVIDVYLPDMRYNSDHDALKYSSSPGYVGNNREIVREMYRQVGELKIRNKLAESGLIIRLLILPGGISGTCETLEYINKYFRDDIHISVMSQYYPAYRAVTEYPELEKRISREEYDSVRSKMRELGFTKGWMQPFNADFDKKFAGETFLSKR